MRYQFEKIGPLDVIEIMGQKTSPTFVLLHGYGADAHDLAPLCHVFKVPQGTNWLVPNGPLEIPMAGYTGRAWAPINMAEWQMAIMQGRPRDLSKDRPPEMFQSQKMLLEMLNARGTDVKDVIFMGFSQGAMLSTHMTLTSSIRPKGLIVLSGSLINAAEWEQNIMRFDGFKYFQSHGRYDDVLPLQGAQNLNKLFKKGGLSGELFIFEGAHDIPPEVIVKAQDYIFSLFPEESFHEKNL